MIKSYFKIALRNLARKKMFSFINIFGLALGLSFAGLIAVYIYEGWRVDKFQPQNLYRVITSYKAKNIEDKLSTVGRALVPAIAAEVPEVEYVIPVRNCRFTIKQNNEYFFDKIAYAGEDFLNAFSFPLLKGDAATALKQPYSVVLTEAMAKKYFGKTDVLGKTILLSDTIPCTITAVLRNLPPSHIEFDVLLSFSTWYAMKNNMNQWFTWDMMCYVKLKDHANVQQATRKISALSMTHNGKDYKSNGYDVKHELEPVRRIYLHSSLPGFNKASGSAKQLYIFAAIGISLLVLACINFINLTTAYQAERGKEVGVKKTMGASSWSLISQFLIETLVMVLIAGVLSAVLIVLMLPFVAEVAGQSLSLSLLSQPVMIITGILLIIIVTLFAGWYPSLLLSRLRPSESIRGVRFNRNSAFSLRRILVVFQFCISLILVIGTLIATHQLQFMRDKKLGFNKDQMVVINLHKTPFTGVIDNYESIKHQLTQISGIKSVTGAAALPGRSAWGGQLVWPEGFPQEKSLTMEVIPADHDYVKTLGIQIKAGRDFSKSFSTDAKYGVLINETACRLIGWKPEQAIGKKIQTPGLDSGQVVGVMADYHQHGLQQKIGPVLVFIYPYGYEYLAASVNSADIKKTVTGMETFWKNRFPGYPFEYFMLNDDFNTQYKAEVNLAKVISLFSLLTILVACLGLFGLTAFIVSQRTKEIGIRKVLGASVPHIVRIISKDFVLLVIIALLIASPFAWWIMNSWLQDFAYRISISAWIFVIAGLAALLIALVTVSWLAIKAALANPVKSLRTE